MRNVRSDSRSAESDPDGRHRIYVEYLLQRLRELEEGSRPSGGTTTAKDKDWHADDALRLAGELVDALAGWAIDHQIGLASAGLERVPPQPDGLNNNALAEYVSQKAAVDLHEHELAGRDIESDRNDPQFARRCLINLLEHPGTVPDWLRTLSVTGLRALEFGDEAPPIFERNPNGNKREEAIRRYELRLLEIVEYRKVAYGTNKGDTEIEIAERIGIEQDTVHGWRKRLVTTFGKLHVDRHFAVARNYASSQKAARAKNRGPASEHEDIDETAQLAEAQYGEEATRVLINLYRAAVWPTDSRQAPF